MYTVYNRKGDLMMRVLIFSVSAGGGHKNAAEAIKSYIELNDPKSDVIILDTLKYINPMLDKVIIGGYLSTIKITPGLFGKLYNVSEDDYGLTSVSTKFNEKMASKLVPFIQKFKPQIIICTHPFPTEMISIMKEKCNSQIPAVAVLTDYAPHSFWLHPNINAYVVSNSDMIDDMVERGIDRDIIFDLGIPVKPSFITNYDRSETLKELGLLPDKTTILIMGGSLGMGKITNVYEELSKVKQDIQIIVIAGKNKKLYYELINLQKSSAKETRVIGYTDKVNKYMQACDLLLTKPGGLTITEALVCKVPLGIFSSIPGQEEKNTEFLMKHNLAISLGNGKNCSEVLEALLSSPLKLKILKQNTCKFSKPNSGNDIYNLLCSLLDKTNKLNYPGSQKMYVKNLDNKLLKSLEKLIIG